MLQLIQQQTRPRDCKVIFLVMDGLGGLPDPATGKTELETAATPELDKLAQESVCGLHLPVRPGITPGSGAAHLGLFGYDPLEFQIGRGALAAAGIDFELQSGDIAARGNFCTVDTQGKVRDRRAGRIETSQNRALCEKLRAISLPDTAVFVEPIKEHRFLLVMRGADLSADIADTDPQATGVNAREPQPRSSQAHKTAELLSSFIARAADTLADQDAANMVLLRGFARRPDWPRFPDVFGMRATAIASYPMYRGLARLLGMDAAPMASSLEQEIEMLRDRYDSYHFFFIHVKQTDSAGEDGDGMRKANAIEQTDRLIPSLRALNPDVIVVTGDHSTPATLHSHSWHPVPILLWSPRCRPDTVAAFGERTCINGGLGPRMPATSIMPLAAAHAGLLAKFGA
jgi:2,3-bisphosphoglycerate-independent phosphoglycerate mutase